MAQWWVIMTNPKHINVMNLHKGGFDQQRCKIC
jgi:hypothetical protein